MHIHNFRAFWSLAFTRYRPSPLPSDLLISTYFTLHVRICYFGFNWQLPLDFTWRLWVEFIKGFLMFAEQWAMVFFGDVTTPFWVADSPVWNVCSNPSGCKNNCNICAVFQYDTVSISPGMAFWNSHVNSLCWKKVWTQIFKNLESKIIFGQLTVVEVLF